MIRRCETIIKKCELALLLRNLVIWHELLSTFQCHIIIDSCHNASWTMMDFPMWHNNVAKCHNATSTLANAAFQNYHWLLFKCHIDWFCNAMNIRMQNDYHYETMISICHIIINKCDVTLLLTNVIIWHKLLPTLQCDIIID